jgi:hypothetical protein
LAKWLVVSILPRPLAKRGKNWERAREKIDDQKVFVAN